MNTITSSSRQHSTSSLTNDEITALESGRFVLHCMQMRLTQAVPDGLVYSGPGVIELREGGQLEFRIYAEQKQSILGFMQAVTESLQIPQGHLLPDRLHYHFSAVDISGREWTSTGVIPSKHSGQGGTLCTGTLHEIHSRSTPSAVGPQLRDHFWTMFPTHVHVPTNSTTELTRRIAEHETGSTSRNVLRFDTDDFEFTFVTKPNSLALSVYLRKDSFATQFAHRINETLQFLVARPLEWAVYEQKTATEWEVCIRSTDVYRMKSKVKPPLAVALNDDEIIVSAFCRLFDRYLEFVCANEPGDRLHRFSAQMRAICTASMRTLEAEALTLGVAIESILPDVFQAKDALTPEEREWLEKAKLYFKSWGGPSQLTQRLMGLLSMLRDQSASGRLRELVSHGAIADLQRKDWELLRNKFAHGGRIPVDNIQEALDLIDRVLVLFYHLVFYAIGYRGEYTNYGESDWQLSAYAAPQPPPQPSA